MACDAQTLETLAYAQGLPALSERDFLICLAGAFLASAGINAQTAVDNAAANNYAGMTDLELDQALLAVFTAPTISAQDLVTAIATQGDDKLDRRDVLLAQVAAFCANGMTTAQAIQTLLCSDGYLAFSAFDDRRAFLSGAGGTAQQLIDQAYASGCGRLSERQLKEILVVTASSVIVPPVVPPVITGQVILAGSPVVMPDVTVAFSNGTNALTDLSGNYSFTNPAPFTGTATPSFSGGIFAPVAGNYVGAQGAITTNYDFIPTQLVVEPIHANGISADAALNAAGGGFFTPLGPMIVTEQLPGDISVGANQTFILSSGPGWKFKPATGNVWFKPGGDIASASISILPTQLTVTMTVSGNTHLDQFAIYNIQVQPDDGANNPNAIFILQASSNPGTMVINGVLQDVTEFSLEFTQPGTPKTFSLVQQPSATATAGAPFATQPEINTLDQFLNQCYNDNSSVVTVSSTGVGHVTGDTVETLVGGDMTFANLAYSNIGSFKLVFSAPGVTPLQSNTVVVS